MPSMLLLSLFYRRNGCGVNGTEQAFKKVFSENQTGTGRQRCDDTEFSQGKHIDSSLQCHSCEPFFNDVISMNDFK